MSRSIDERLTDILDAISRARVADRRLQEAAGAGDTDGVQMAFDAILYDLFIAGEAVKSLPGDVLAGEPDVPWADIKGMRDVIGHSYHQIVPAVIHATVARDLEVVADAVQRMEHRRTNT